MAKSKWSEQVPCPECGSLYTRRGLPTHRFSGRCRSNIARKQVNLEIDEIESTQCVGKRRVTTVFAQAIKRRAIQDTIGLICVRTKVYETSDGDWERRQEYWADEWAAKFYRMYLVNQSLKVYDDLVRVSKLPPDQQEMHKQLMLLKYTDIDG